ncbi:flagellar basal body P-ring formation protein FlgA [Halomonas qinghailakensis]|uniref:Flagella basal body P-ring formation protein FlgA n=2 Tax=Halomonas TaxID=2745 RepID=A0AA46TSX5_9GAMM|nr:MULTISPECIES: flagellar basal body P-ring formation chaperone FlgA [Halomonas]UYO75940.1 flagellar basal body P-ring formation protein FlgA [Halomonas sp. ZZQ-149]UYV19183.1 flagellar basal body P-ring formation protein FlgA [Halomonas qaidamensis]
MPHPLQYCLAILKQLLLLLLFSLCLSLQAHASNDLLMDTVQQFLYQESQALGQEVMIDITPPSPHLPTCVSPEPFFPNANHPPLGRVSVGVRCGENRRQVRYIQAQIDIIGSYAVAGQDIDRGTLITGDMLTLREGNLGDLASQALTDQNDIVGMVAQRPIRSGSTFQSHYLQAPQVVKRGQRVTVIAEGAGFRVSREGEALSDGAQGERIRVRFDTRELVTARVIGQGTLVIDF